MSAGRAVSHEGAPICAGCGEDWPCSDSVAEAQVQADEEAERSLRARYNDLLVDHARLAAQVLRVRELRDRFATHEKSISYQAAATLLTRALDGDGPGCQGTPDKASTPKPAAKIPKKKIPGKVRAKKVESVEEIKSVDEEITLTEYTITISSDDDSLFDLLTQHLGQKTVDDLVLLAMYHDRFVRVKG